MNGMLHLLLRVLYHALERGEDVLEPGVGNLRLRHRRCGLRLQALGGGSLLRLLHAGLSGPLVQGALRGGAPKLRDVAEAE